MRNPIKAQSESRKQSAESQAIQTLRLTRKKGKKPEASIERQIMPSPSQFKNFLQVRPEESFPGGGKAEILIDENDCGKRARAELVELQAEEGFPVHTHPKSDHIILVVHGNGDLLWENEVRKITCGDTFVVPMGDVHSIKAGSDGPLRFVVINVPPVDFHHHDFMQPVESHDHESGHSHTHKHSHQNSLDFHEDAPD